MTYLISKSEFDEIRDSEYVEYFQNLHTHLKELIQPEYFDFQTKYRNKNHPSYIDVEFSYNLVEDYSILQIKVAGIGFQGVDDNGNIIPISKYFFNYEGELVPYYIEQIIKSTMDLVSSHVLLALKQREDFPFNWDKIFEKTVVKERLSNLSSSSDMFIYYLRKEIHYEDVEFS